MKTTYFTPAPQTLEELKAMYKKLAFENHPDRGGDTATMQQINAEYQSLFESLKNVHRNAQGERYESAPKTENPETASEFIDLISRLVKVPGVTVELCGSWLWVSGNTYDVREELKSLGFRFSRDKAAWYYHRPGYYKRGKKTKTLDEIRNMYKTTRFAAKTESEVVPA